MGSAKTVESATTTTPAATSYCRKKQPEDGTFLTNLKTQFYEFINTPMDEHKACFKLTVQKMVGKFGEKTSSSAPKEEENSVVPTQKSSKN